MLSAICIIRYERDQGVTNPNSSHTRNMLRRIVFVFVIALSVQMVCSDPTSSKNQKILREADEDLVLDLDVLAHPNLHKREVGTILLAIKDQFREIIEEMLTDACSLMKTILYQFKMNLLKKFESYTMANLLRVIINGVTDFTTLYSDPELSFDEAEDVEGVQVAPVQLETYNYRNPYYPSAFSTTFRDKRE